MLVGEYVRVGVPERVPLPVATAVCVWLLVQLAELVPVIAAVPVAVPVDAAVPLCVGVGVLDGCTGLSATPRNVVESQGAASSVTASVAALMRTRPAGVAAMTKNAPVVGWVQPVMPRTVVTDVGVPPMLTARLPLVHALAHGDTIALVARVNLDSVPAAVLKSPTQRDRPSGENTAAVAVE